MFDCFCCCLCASTWVPSNLLVIWCYYGVKHQRAYNACIMRVSFLVELKIIYWIRDAEWSRRFQQRAFFTWRAFTLYRGITWKMYKDIRKWMNLCHSYITLHKKWSFPLRISSVNVTKTTGNCGFGITFTEEILNGKLQFLCSVNLWVTP